uniref:Uncharacterized protein n=1 Tax=Plectus sambesii TaxID=2011161 RepID=A0A914XM56_9BILA
MRAATHFRLTHDNARVQQTVSTTRSMVDHARGMRRRSFCAEIRSIRRFDGEIGADGRDGRTDDAIALNRRRWSVPSSSSRRATNARHPTNPTTTTTHGTSSRSTGHHLAAPPTHVPTPPAYRSRALQSPRHASTRAPNKTTSDTKCCGS